MTTAHEKTALKELQKLPNVGPAIAKDLLLLGIFVPGELRGRSPEALYRELEAKTGSRQDPCVLDTFMAVVHFANTGEARSWWSFTAERKQVQESANAAKLSSL